VQSQKPQKIDLNTDYPCPCRRQGRLIPIVLTDAMGCDRCQKIFVVEENGYAIEQLATNYPQKQTWRWVGNRWITAQSYLKQSYLPIAIGAIVILLFVWLPSALHVPSGANFLIWAMVAVIVAIIPAFIHWLTYRR